MGGEDKALAVLGGRRLIDIVLERLTPQADIIVISGRHHYGTDLVTISDAPDGPTGPVAGVFAVARWLVAHQPSAQGFVTAPVDGPFLPHNLVERLCAAGGTAVAVDDEGVHPTFAYWALCALEGAWQEIGGEGSVSLRRLAETCGGRQIRWPNARYFRNINTPDDLKAAEFLVDVDDPSGR